MPQSVTSPAKPLLALAIMCLLWGYNWVALKIALRHPLKLRAWKAAWVVGSLLPPKELSG